MNTHPNAELRAAVPYQPPTPVIHVVDDDPGVRTALVRLLAANGYDSHGHASGEAFLSGYEPGSYGCVLLDVWMPGVDGLMLQEKLGGDRECPPIIFLTGCAEIPICASAMRSGAVDYLTKPVDENHLLRAITRALSRSAQQLSSSNLQAATSRRLESLTPREREVLTHVMDGRLNKQIAADLGTAEKTVKVHRARAMEKMRVRSVAELVRMVERAQAAGLQLS